MPFIISSDLRGPSQARGQSSVLLGAPGELRAGQPQEREMGAGAQFVLRLHSGSSHASFLRPCVSFGEGHGWRQGVRELQAAGRGSTFPASWPAGITLDPTWRIWSSPAADGCVTLSKFLPYLSPFSLGRQGKLLSPPACLPHAPSALLATLPWPPTSQEHMPGSLFVSLPPGTATGPDTAQMTISCRQALVRG